MSGKYPFRRAATVMLACAVIVFLIGYFGGYALPKWARSVGAFYLALCGMSCGPMFSFENPNKKGNEK